MSIESFRVNVLCLIALTIACSPSAVTGAGHADDARRRLLERTPSHALQRMIGALFDSASSVAIKYTDLDTAEPAYFTAEVADSNWQYSIVRRCNYGCGSSLPELRRRLESGLRIAGTCPAPFAIVVDFRSDKQNKNRKIYVNGTGQCFNVDEQSFFLPEHDSILNLLKNSVSGL